METAIVGVIGAFIGILLSNLATVLLEIRRRRERIKDVQTSLRAEIRSHWHRLAPPIELDDRAEIIVSRIREASERGLDFTPFIPREDPAVVFASVAGEIHILPNDVIDPIVLYYAHLNALSHFVDDLRSERFATLQAARKIEMYEDYIAMKKQARDLADVAIRAIDVSLAQGSAQ